jgi:hypothetical protein
MTAGEALGVVDWGRSAEDSLVGGLEAQLVCEMDQVIRLKVAEEMVGLWVDDLTTASATLDALSFCCSVVVVGYAHAISDTNKLTNKS